MNQTHESSVRSERAAAPTGECHNHIISQNLGYKSTLVHYLVHESEPIFYSFTNARSVLYIIPRQRV